MNKEENKSTAASNGQSKPEEPPNVVALKVALHAQLVAVLEKPFSQRMLLELESCARLCRELLLVTKDPRQRSQTQGSYYGSNIAMPIGPSQVIGFGDEEGLGSDLPGGGMMLNPMRAETFGATLIRELVASMKDWKTPKPTAGELIQAIASAKQEKLDAEIVSGLERQLKDLLSSTTITEPRLPEPVAPQKGHEEHEHG